MKNFKLKEDEEIQVIRENINVLANNNRFTLTLFLTNKRIILFKDINKELDYNKFLQARAIYIPANNEVAFDLALTKIKDITYKDNINILTFKDNDYTLSLYCDNLTKYLN